MNFNFFVTFWYIFTKILSETFRLMLKFSVLQCSLLSIFACAHENFFWTFLSRCRISSSTLYISLKLLYIAKYFSGNLYQSQIPIRVYEIFPCSTSVIGFVSTLVIYHVCRLGFKQAESEKIMFYLFHFQSYDNWHLFCSVVVVVMLFACILMDLFYFLWIWIAHLLSHFMFSLIFIYVFEWKIKFNVVMFNSFPPVFVLCIILIYNSVLEVIKYVHLFFKKLLRFTI